VNVAADDSEAGEPVAGEEAWMLDTVPDLTSLGFIAVAVRIGEFATVWAVEDPRLSSADASETSAVTLVDACAPLSLLWSVASVASPEAGSRTGSAVA
jgi:hypothetical protein